MAVRDSLIVDPHADTRALYANRLQNLGWRTVDAKDGLAGLSAALATHPQLLVTELRLPRIDGANLIEILRGDQKLASTVIIVITSDARATALKRGHRAGADAVFSKPADLDEVFGRVDSLLRQRLDCLANSAALRLCVDDVLANANARISRTKALAKTMGRYATTTPPQVPPSVTCQICDAPLSYQRSYVGGVNARSSEQWDYYECPNGCGQFQYRHRTRKLRQVR